MSEADYRQMQLNNYELIKQFDRKVIAQHYIDLALQKETGYLNELRVKTNHDPSLQRQAQQMFDDHFETKQEVDLESLFG
jgi:hypothetical protein